MPVTLTPGAAHVLGLVREISAAHRRLQEIGEELSRHVELGDGQAKALAADALEALSVFVVPDADSMLQRLESREPRK